MFVSSALTSCENKVKLVKQVKDKYLKGVVDKYRAATKVAIYGIAFYKKECRVNLEIVIVW